jgi:phosphocarrier protein
MINKPLKNREDNEAKGDFIVKNDRGLHTRPCTEIVKCVASYKSDIKLRHRRMEVNAKSLLGILMLAATKGSKIKVEANGIDAKEAVSSLVSLASNNFNIKY